jgi:nitroreductase/NAD-dependent dihydropyrimidine dehydrogenase PreA subunit
MSIIGIDKEKCSNCKQCIQECGSGYFSVNENKEVVFNENLPACSICGHCIAICPENAILTKDLNDVESFEGIDSPKTIITYDNFYKLSRAKRSIRRYKSKIVPHQLIEKVFNVMRYAPSGGNTRLWRYLIISDPEKIEELSDAIVKAMYRYRGFESEDEALKSIKSRGRNVFFNAPHLIVLYYETVEKIGTIIGLRGNDAGIALTYGMLAAETLGLGTCWIGGLQIAIPMNREIMNTLGIKGYVLGAFTLGYPAVKYLRTTPRPPLKIKELEK